MAVSRRRGAIGLLIAGSMFFSSTGAVAATASASAYQPDPWAVLSVMSGGASAAGGCGGGAGSGGAPAALFCAAPAAPVVAAHRAAGCVLPQVDAAPPVASNPPPQPIPVP